jgi:hypothetical protein
MRLTFESPRKPGRPPVLPDAAIARIRLLARGMSYAAVAQIVAREFKLESLSPAYCSRLCRGLARIA